MTEIKTSKESDFPLFWKITLGGLCVLLLAFSILFIYKFYVTFDGVIFPSDNTRADWGTFGDYFGGVLNPIFGFASFLALLVTIIYQAKELKLSRTELELTRNELSNSAIALKNQNRAIELQSFEQTFFSWLSTYRELLNTVSASTHFKDFLHGRDALHYLWKNNLDAKSILNSMRTYNQYGEFDSFKPEFDSTYDANFKELSSYKQIEIISDSKQDFVANHIHQIWCILYQDQEYQLDTLFRTAYRLISWIDSQQTERLDENQKWLYVSIFRSQLSWIEMVFLYYNGLTGSGKKFKLLIEKYALFDNLTFDSEIGIKVMNKHYNIENNYLKSAFSSELARSISPTNQFPLTPRRATET